MISYIIMNLLVIFCKRTHSRFQVTCVTTEGEATSNVSLAYRTGPGFPLSGPTVNGTALNHTAVLLQWADPPIQTLRGISLSYKISYEIVGIAGFYVYGKVFGNVSAVVVGGLRPSTSYNFRVCSVRRSHQRCSIEKGVLKISQYSQEITCVVVKFMEMSQLL